MVKAGFKNTHHHVVKHEEESMSTDEYLDRVRKKYISTLTLLSEEEFQRGISVFARRVREKYGEQIRRIMGFDFVLGEK